MQLIPIQTIKTVLGQNAKIAVIGLSPKPDRPSHQVASYLQQKGYKVIPVNPGHDSILGEKCYPSLGDVPEQVDIVNIFRRAEHVLPIVREAVQAKAKVIWMQEGIKHEEAARLAEENGLVVIMDRCIKVDHINFMM